MTGDRRPPESLLDPERGRLPYSKGLMARTLSATGVSPWRAYELARLIEGELTRTDEQAGVDAPRLFEVAASVLREHEGADAVRRLRQYQALAELDLPLILLVGGATGTGKSTVTTEVAHRLGITRVTSTDFVRQTMRAFFSREFMPAIHYSSYEAGPAVSAPEEDPTDPNLLGFLDQTRNVLVGVKAVLDRALEEGYSMALEGVHVVPGMLAVPPAGKALVVQCVLAIDNEEEHASHFWIRDATSEGLRPVDKYLERLPDIRRIQGYLVERAHRHGVPVIDNSRIEGAIDQVIHLILNAVEEVRAPA